MPGNPFRPSFGTSPRVLAGRAGLLDEFDVALGEGPGSPMRSILISGPRGMGKTVVLNELEDRARTRGWHVVRLPEGPGMVEETEQSLLPGLLARVDPAAEQRRVTGGGIHAVGSISTEIDHTYPHTQSLTAMLARLATLAAERGTGVLLTLDEVQSVEVAEVSRLASAYQHLLRDDHEIAFVGAGLPVGIATLLKQRGTTFLRRAERLQLGPLDEAEVADAAVRTVRAAGRVISPEAVRLLVRIAHGYPYLLQLVGYHAWRAAGTDEVITERDVERTREVVVDRMSRLVHTPALLDVPPGQLDYLHAMAQDDGPSATGLVAERLGVSRQHANVVRTRLIARELIAPAGHGLVDVALPYLREHLRRVGE
ncbi:ATP-binding protein [Serinicoccus sp. LYQ131]|uniref:ATP-binding protein n=1 Tax=Serinicoccus sp. LYQ131 TaxID=3378797 RepID=UPI00385337CC